MASATTNIRVSCPNCAKVLRLNTRPAKGKKITCPVCSEAFTPQTDDDETRVQDAPSVVAKASANKSSRKRASEDEEDDAPKRKRRSDAEEDDDDAPRKKKKKAKKQGNNTMMFVVLLGGGGGVLLLGCIALAITAFVWPGFMLAKAGNVGAAKGGGNNVNLNNIKPPMGGGNAAALAFNNNVANGNKRIVNECVAFTQAIAPARQGLPSNVAEVRRTHKAMKDALDAVKAETQAWQIPPGANAKNLFDSYQRFLKVEEDIINGFGEVVRVLENAALNPQQKATQIQAILVRAGNLEPPALADLQAKQRAFAAENNIILMPGG